MESIHSSRTRYLVVVSHTGKFQTEESCLLGIDCNKEITIGLVLPVWADTRITLDGDGSVQIFSIFFIILKYLSSSLAALRYFYSKITNSKQFSQCMQGSFYTGFIYLFLIGPLLCILEGSVLHLVGGITSSNQYLFKPCGKLILPY